MEFKLKRISSLRRFPGDNKFHGFRLSAELLIFVDSLPEKEPRRHGATVLKVFPGFIQGACFEQAVDFTAGGEADGVASGRLHLNSKITGLNDFIFERRPDSFFGDIRRKLNADLTFNGGDVR